ncbi:MAG: class B sortase [Clostridia bacterium]|nr:class B sortase [Clostridia bacterium]
MTKSKNNRSLLALVLALCLFAVGCSQAATAPTPTPLPQKEAVTAKPPTVSPPPINDTDLFSYEGQPEQTLYDFYCQNEDTIGWLTIPGIKTDNVVMMGQEGKKYASGKDGRDHYLNSSFTHASRTSGELYIDTRCHVGYDTISQNITLYGHHMKDGSMLSGLDYYENKNYWQNHQYFTLQTLWNTYHYRVFGIFVIDLNRNQHLEFDFRKESFASEQEFTAFIDEVKRRSMYQTDVPIDGDDKVINLVTCTYPTGNPDVDNARLIMMGRLCTDPQEIQAAEAALAEK